MTPSERALLVAIGYVLSRNSGDLHLAEMVNAVKTEDDQRPVVERMPLMSREAYNDRLRRS